MCVCLLVRGQLPSLPGYIILRVGQNRICTPYMTVYSVNYLSGIPYIHRKYMVLANPSNFHAKNTVNTPCVHGSGRP